ncbi:phosphatidylserine decarboxylase [Roseococcus sp. SDR]|uniref:phosphatidylserine decarboxylase n=1 Tax=Roseococcus sp. SDR TaxID=2835532 RepID=UPI001BD08928|nr:phosphatidylserine decarboxylase [Roseococcus sp. SDR]MBS7788518.1 phosphatidylserine decarboxylase [Roseococcus sp. SDR]MBV1843832.1 phosphatidylserine decarboxylase [Roseococcus sp. SDR]
MSLANSLSLVLAPPHPAGRPFIYAGAGVALLGGLVLGSWLFWLGTAFTLFCLYFFRDPKRVPPARHDLVLAPADGKVVLVGPAIPPAELEMGDQPRWRVAIFLSVLDVHVNRSPVQGRISRISYRHGKFMDASLEKASEENERNALRFDLPDGRDLACVQIAGLVARRIVCTVHEGDRLMAGERFGIIRFGSRTDVYLPVGVKPLVLVGQTMIGGESILAELA